MKKFLTILLAMSMMSCTFASCGKKDSDKEDKKSSVAEEEVLPAVGRWEPVDTEDMIFDIRSENEAYICVVQDLSDALYFEDDNFMFWINSKFKIINFSCLNRFESSIY